MSSPAKNYKKRAALLAPGTQDKTSRAAARPSDPKAPSKAQKKFRPTA